MKLVKPFDLVVLDNNYIGRVWKNWPAWPGTQLCDLKGTSIVVILEIIPPTMNTTQAAKILLSTGEIGFVSYRAINKEI